jgi:hypothetical protein
VKFSRAVRPCCGHSVETSYHGYCTLLTCECVCRDHCAHLQVTVPGEARRDERLLGAALYGWCRSCRLKVDDAHIRTLRPQRTPGAAIYWLGEADDSQPELDAIAAHADAEAGRTSAVNAQLTLFSLSS